MAARPIKRDPSKVLQLGFLGLLFISVLQVAFWVSDNLRYTELVRNEIATIPVDEPSVAAAIERIDGASAGRANRYLWEGGFFLLVLLAGMTVLTRTIRHDADLRRRQQNFLAAVSHEFKSPLASMQLAAETLMLRAREDDSRRLGERILEDCERLLRMVENLLDTTRLEEGQPVLAPEATALDEVVSSAVAALSDRAQRHQIAISASVPQGLSAMVDRGAIETILSNLLDNALKASIAGNGHSITIAAARHDGQVVLTVTDDGHGFPPEDAELMFEKFYRPGDEQTRTTPGTGLGLYIVRRLAMMSGGSVAAASDGPGTGATFTVKLGGGAA